MDNDLWASMHVLMFAAAAEGTEIAHKSHTVTALQMSPLLAHEMPHRAQGSCSTKAGQQTPAQQLLSVLVLPDKKIQGNT
jgi:hypothetical protein